MTLNFQNKIVFPAPECSYSIHSAFKQVIYLPRNIMQKTRDKKAHEQRTGQSQQSGQTPSLLKNSQIIS
jgi:hypothetical protein